MQIHRFSWNNIDPLLQKALAKAFDDSEVNLAEILSTRFGPMPGEDFIKECWPELLKNWLYSDLLSLRSIAGKLRESKLGNIETPDDYEYMQTCRNAKQLRRIVLAEFIRLGEAQATVVPALNLQKSALTSNPSLSQSTLIPSVSRCEISKSGNKLLNTGDSLHLRSLPRLLAHSQKLLAATSRWKLIAGTTAAVFCVTLIGIVWSNLEYREIVELGEKRHVNKLLSLPEKPATAKNSLSQLERFRKGNWRNYISRRSLNALNQKGIRLYRAIEVESLRNFVFRSSTIPITEASTGMVYEAFAKVKASPAFRYLDKNLQKFSIDRASLAVKVHEQVRARKVEAERKEKEAAELQAKLKREEEERQVAAAEQAERERLAAETATIEEPETPISSTGYQIGPRGGCFYWSGSRKVYVDHSNCY